MKNDLTGIRAMMRFGYLSATGRGLSERLNSVRKTPIPGSGSLLRMVDADLSAEADESGADPLVVIAWQLGYGF